MSRLPISLDQGEVVEFLPHSGTTILLRISKIKSAKKRKEIAWALLSYSKSVAEERIGKTYTVEIELEENKYF